MFHVCVLMADLHCQGTVSGLQSHTEMGQWLERSCSCWAGPPSWLPSESVPDKRASLPACDSQCCPVQTRFLHLHLIQTNSSIHNFLKLFFMLSGLINKYTVKTRFMKYLWTYQPFYNKKLAFIITAAGSQGSCAIKCFLTLHKKRQQHFSC